MRYFFFSAFYNTSLSSHDITSFGIKTDLFPSKEALKNEVVRYSDSAYNIAILSICELSKEDYETFFNL